MLKKMMGKKAMEVKEYVVALVILAILLALIFFSYFVIKGKGTGALEFIRNLLRFGGS